jgi:RHS repeat-associated protein
MEVRSRRGDEPDFGPWTQANVVIKPLNFAVSNGNSVDYEVRIIEEKSEEGEDEPDEDGSGGTTTGGGTPDIPAGSQDQAPGTGGQPSAIDPVSFYSTSNLGTGGEGTGVGAIGLSGPIAPGLASSSNLYLLNPGVDDGLTEVEDGGGALRQIASSAGLVDIHPVSGGGTELRYYKPGDFTAPVAPSTLYTINSGALPFKSVKYLPIAAVSGVHLGGVRTITAGMRGTTYTRDVVSTGSDGQSYRIVEENGLRVTDVVSVFEWVEVAEAWHRTDTVVEKRDGADYSKSIKTYAYQVRREGGVVTASREFLLSSNDFIDATNSLETTYVPHSYFLGKVQTMFKPDGSWVHYHYYTGNETEAQPDWKGLLKTILRPWDNSPATPGPAEPWLPDNANSGNSESTTILYSEIFGSSGYEEESRITTLPGTSKLITVKKSTAAEPFPVTGLIGALTDAGIHTSWLPDSSELDGIAEDTYSAASDASYNSHYTYKVPGFSWSGSTCASVDDLGSGTVSGYEMGNYNAGTGGFTVDTTGTGVAATHVRRTDVEMLEGALTPLESTKLVTIADLKNRLLRRELWIYDAGSAWSLATTTTYEYPTLWLDGSVRESIEKKDGRIVRRVYQTSGTETHEWDEQGIETVTVTDLIGRITSVTTVGTTGSPAQPDRVSSYAYSGRTTFSTQSGGGLAISTSQIFDLVGRLVTSVASNGARTTYTYPNGGRDVSVVLPGGLTRLETRRFDGRLISISGTSVVDEAYDYSVLSTGNITTKISLGDLVSSPRYKVTERDWAGRTVKVTSPSPTGTGEVFTSYSYEPWLSRLASVAAPNGTTLYQYGAGSTLVLSGRDDPADSDAVLTTDSMDRVAETQRFYSYEGGFWWSVSSSKQYDGANISTTAVTMASKECLHGAPGGDAARSVRIAPTGETTTTITTIDRANKTRVATETITGVTNTQVTTNINGLTVSNRGRDATNATIYSYDGLGRLVKSVSPRGEVTVQGYHADGSLASVTDHGNKTTSYGYYPASHASAGKLHSITDPQGGTRTLAYSSRGEVTEEAGTAAYKVTYEYDAFGMKKKMFTWRDSSTSDPTEWIYQNGTGLLSSKKDAANQAVTYTYYASGKIERRTWARGVTTDYAYDSFGDLTGVNYSDSTPDVTLGGYDRLGRPGNVTQTGLGSEVMTYLPGKQGLRSRYYSGATGSGLTIHKLLPGRGVRYTDLDSAGRSSGFIETRSTTPSSDFAASTYSYGYDAAGRLETITNSTQSVAYGYHPNSSLISTIENKTSGTAWFQESRHYDIRNRLTGIRSQRLGSSTAQLTTHAYVYDSLGRRTKNTFQDGSNWEYGYNDRSEVISAIRRTAAGTLVPPLGATYDYDGIGNRLASTSGVLGDHTYIPNSLNQYATVTTDDSRTAVGRADSSWDILVNTVSASRIGDIYYSELSPVTNTGNPVWQAVETKRTTGTPSSTDHFWYAKASTTPAYDADGNLLSDGYNTSTSTHEGRWVYTWDAENRLIKMETSATAVTAGMSYTKLEFEYDWEGRRIARHVWKGGTSGSPTFVSSRRWLYDGWNPVAEFSGTSASAATGATDAVLTRYTWGTDLSGSFQGAGGIGGLVLQTTVSSGVMERPSYDGNGNIVTWTMSTGTAPTARREYDGFGNVVMGENVWPSVFGFSTKIGDPETGLLYYGYRYHRPEHGRWISRDPIEEKGGLNLYGFVKNDGVSEVDVLGLIPVQEPKYSIPPVWDLRLGSGGKLGEYANGGVILRIRSQDEKKCCLRGEIKFGQDPYIWVDSVAGKKFGVSYADLAIHETAHAAATIKRIREIADQLIDETECYDTEELADQAGRAMLSLYSLKLEATLLLESMHAQGGGYGTPPGAGFD